MALLRCWYINKRLKKEEEWLIPKENSLKKEEFLQKLDLYDEADFFLQDALLKELISFKFVVYAIIKYIAVFFIALAIFDKLSYRVGDDAFFPAIILSIIITILYKRRDEEIIANRINEARIQIGENRARILTEAVEILLNKIEEQKKPISGQGIKKETLPAETDNYVSFNEQEIDNNEPAPVSKETILNILQAREHSNYKDYEFIVFMETLLKGAKDKETIQIILKTLVEEYKKPNKEKQ
nr:MAG TPA: hypothetical protein [Caudoviricetes sp.]